MYINDLGLGRIASVNNKKNTAKTAAAIDEKNTGSYAAVMQKALENRKTAGIPAFASAGDIIIQEAFKKMETDPEWEKSVMGKVKEYYAGDNSSYSTQNSYLNLMGQNGLQNYLIQSLIGGQSTLGLGLTRYSPYGVSNLAASAYGNVMNSALSSSLFGNWQL